ncbi:MAG: glutathione S-transferase N-terminal domain-containing protein [Alphaproteobacteria bacterium]
MRLFWTPASPFTRKVAVAARELGLWELIEVAPTTWPHEWGYATVAFTAGLAEANPVARIPTLITDDGVALGCSTLICQHLNEQAEAAAVIPPGARQWPMWSLYAVADGLLEAQVGMRAEMLRPDAARSEGYLQKQRDRIARCFDHMEERAGELELTAGAVPNLAQITAAIACGYQDWRDWLADFRPGRPDLSLWYDGFRLRPAMRATEPKDTPEA